jgi:hypothetical protein
MLSLSGSTFVGGIRTYGRWYYVRRQATLRASWKVFLGKARAGRINAD